ncbi:unnamed protein product, partial [Prorocentrum cordatum]
QSALPPQMGQAASKPLAVPPQAKVPPQEPQQGGPAAQAAALGEVPLPEAVDDQRGAEAKGIAVDGGPTPSGPDAKAERSEAGASTAPGSNWKGAEPAPRGGRCSPVSPNFWVYNVGRRQPSAGASARPPSARSARASGTSPTSTRCRSPPDSCSARR